jgi:DNA-directed RNA polymerase subunit RPC12/RpoP
MSSIYDFEQGNCPNCGVSWQGEEIAEESRKFYGTDTTHFSRVIGVEYSYDSPERYDGVSEYQCTYCGARFGRWTGKKLEDNELEPRWGEERDTK